MPGGNKNIKPSDNPKPFTSDYNGSNFTKWTEEKCHVVLERLENWLLEEVEIKDKHGNVIGTKDAGNCYFEDFLFKERLFRDWIRYVSKKYTTVSARIENIRDIHQMKLQMLASMGIHNTPMNKFVLENTYGWASKSETKNINTNITWEETKSYGGGDDEFTIKKNN